MDYFKFKSMVIPGPVIDSLSTLNLPVVVPNAF